jgi:hypothetical protein
MRCGLRTGRVIARSGRLEIRQHNRYDYSPITGRPDYDWPDGKRLEFYIGLNIEHFGFGEGLGHTPTSPGPQPDVRNYAWCGKAAEVSEIGENLGVGYILKGSEQKLGSRLRVNAQLFDARRSSPLCAKRFNRNLGEILRFPLGQLTNGLRPYEPVCSSPVRHDPPPLKWSTQMYVNEHRGGP